MVWRLMYYINICNFYKPNRLEKSRQIRCFPIIYIPVNEWKQFGRNKLRRCSFHKLSLHRRHQIGLNNPPPIGPWLSYRISTFIGNEMLRTREYMPSSKKPDIPANASLPMALLPKTKFTVYRMCDERQCHIPSQLQGPEMK